MLVVAGLLVAISALWMTLFYEAQPGTGDLLYMLRLSFGSALAACLVPPPDLNKAGSAR